MNWRPNGGHLNLEYGNSILALIDDGSELISVILRSNSTVFGSRVAGLLITPDTAAVHRSKGCSASNECVPLRNVRHFLN